MIKANINLTNRLKIELDIQNMGIKYTKQDTNQTTTKQPHKKCTTIPFNLPNIKLNMSDGYVKYNNNLLEYDHIITRTNKNKVDFILDKNQTNISLYLDKNKVYLNLDNLNTNFINSLAGKKLFKGGFIDLYTSGTQCNLKGDAQIQNLNIKDAAILKDIFLVINSAPALINPLLILPNAYRFASDEFSLSEYEIKKGNFNFNINRDKSTVDLPQFNITGVYSDFDGSANIDLYQSKIKSKINIIFMKDYAKIINYIPLVNYIMLGDEKRFSYSVDVDGNLTEPKVTTHMTKETVMAPINMIKRVFMLPLLPFKDSNK
jgi:hypothetical protein